MAATAAGPFFQSLTASPHDFLQPSLPLHTDALAYLKNALDPVALDVSNAQNQRLLEARKKRKRGEVVSEEEILRLKQVHIRGFGAEQVWEQAKRVIEAARKEAEVGLKEAEAREAESGESDQEGAEEESELGEEGVDWTYDGVDVDGEEEDSEGEGEEDSEMLDGEDGHDDYEEDDVDMGSEDLDEDDARAEEPAQEFVEDKFGLNDGFFSIDDFNKQSEFMEQQGDEEGAGSDDEDIDWDADPATMAQGNTDADGAAEDESEDEEDGPTFGDPDAPSEDEDEDLEEGDMDMGGMGNTNNVMYADFFAPPAQKARKNKKGRPNPHNFPAKSAAPENDEDQDEDMTRTMEAVHRDLFEDESEEEDEDNEELDPADPKSRRSAHERRKLALQEEIRKLEAANVAKREWTLSGEARAADRPVNSLLEEDLDFERAGKPVPVITAEVSEGLEELIKRRILAHDFQDIIRRRPDDLATGRRGQMDFELDNNKSKKGLAEEYEEEHLRNTDPNYVEEKDEKVAKEEKEIEALWREVSANLDSLSSWHFKPKRPEAQLDIRVDAPTITMEDARPNAGGEVAGASQLAPQEIYKAGESSKGNGAEVVGKSGLPAGREELTREEKTRRRRRDKERARKAGTNEPTKVESKKSKDKKEILGDLKKGGVKVINNKGEMKDVEGNKVKTNVGGTQGASRYML
jgi:U3 small nucleolar RNA-associated protein MPP10